MMSNSGSDAAGLLDEIVACGLTISVVDDRLRLAGPKRACEVIARRVAAARSELLELLRERESLVAYADRILPRIESIALCTGGAHYPQGRPCELCVAVQAAIDRLPPLAAR